MAKVKSKSRSTAKKKAAAKPKVAARTPASKQKKPLLLQAQWKLDVAENTKIIAPIGDELRPLWQQVVSDLYIATKAHWPRTVSSHIAAWELIAAVLVGRDEPGAPEPHPDDVDPKLTAILDKCLPDAERIIERYERQFKMSVFDVRFDNPPRRTVLFAFDAIGEYRTKDGAEPLTFEAHLVGAPATLHSVTSQAVYTGKPASIQAAKKKFDIYWKKAKQKLCR